MTDILKRWTAHRATCHMTTDSELLGDEMAAEIGEFLDERSVISGIMELIKILGDKTDERFIDAFDLAKRIEAHFDKPTGDDT